MEATLETTFESLSLNQGYEPLESAVEKVLEAKLESLTIHEPLDRSVEKVLEEASTVPAVEDTKKVETKEDEKEPVKERNPTHADIFMFKIRDYMERIGEGLKDWPVLEPFEKDPDFYLVRNMWEGTSWTEKNTRKNYRTFSMFFKSIGDVQDEKGENLIKMHLFPLTEQAEKSRAEKKKEKQDFRDNAIRLEPVDKKTQGLPNLQRDPDYFVTDILTLYFLINNFDYEPIFNGTSILDDIHSIRFIPPMAEIARDEANIFEEMKEILNFYKIQFVRLYGKEKAKVPDSAPKETSPDAK